MGDMGAGDPYREFRPHPVMRRFLYVISLGILTVSTLPWSLPLTLLVHNPYVFWIIGVGVHAVYVVLALWFLSWVPRYYGSAIYRIGGGWLEAEGGVYWRRKLRLPAGRVQMVQVTQGPWQRKYGVYSVSVHTAARGSETEAELGYVNVQDGEALRDRILSEARAAGLPGSGLEGPGLEGPGLEAPGLEAPAIGELTHLARLILEELRSRRP